MGTATAALSISPAGGIGGTYLSQSSAKTLFNKGVLMSCLLAWCGPCKIQRVIAVAALGRAALGGGHPGFGVQTPSTRHTTRAADAQQSDCGDPAVLCRVTVCVLLMMRTF